MTLTGTNFSTNLSGNMVFFGAVRANISSASATSLTVEVPAGATYQPIQVSVAGLTAFSSQPFLQTFAGGIGINKNSFAAHFDSTTGLYPNCVATTDLDGDGNPDLVTSNRQSNTISILKNTTTNQNISFAVNQELPCPDLPFNINVVAGDLDNDGKPEIALTTFSGFSVFRNTSTNGTVSFAPRLDYSGDGIESSREIAIADFDGDGKADIAIVDRRSYSNPPAYGIISIYRNASTGSNITFDPRVSLKSVSAYAFTGVFCLRSADLNNDQKTDLAFTFNAPFFSAFRNTSVPGTISFIDDSVAIALPANCAPRGLAIGDLNSDNKPEAIVAAHFIDSLSVIKNTSSAGRLSFKPKTDFATDGTPRSVSLNDLNGDGKLEIVTTNFFFVGYSGTLPLSVFQSDHIGDSIILKPADKFKTTNVSMSSVLVDLNRDGKADIVTANSGGSASVSILRNRVGETVALCAPGSTTISSNISGLSYQWQVSTDSISFTDLINNSNYSGSNTGSLNLANIPSSFYGRQYRCLVDNNIYSKVFDIAFSNQWLGSMDSNWENLGNWSCGTVPDINTDVIVMSGTIILNSSTSIRSLQIDPSVTFTVAAGVNLTITH